MKAFAVMLIGAVLMISAPVSAGWRLVEAGEPATVAKSAMTVTPPSAWNRNTSRPIKNSEVWTLDGLTLNELYFVGGLEHGKPLFNEFDKKNNPLPKFKADLLLPEVVDFFESSARTYLGTSIFEVENVEPVKLGGYDGVQFAFRFATQGDDLANSGLARAAIIDGKLYLMSFIAPSIYYYDRDVDRAEALFDTLKF